MKSKDGLGIRKEVTCVYYETMELINLRDDTKIHAAQSGTTF